MIDKRVTIILPIFNATKFVSRWFDSLSLSVNVDNLYILAIDNGSSDGTQEQVLSRLRDFNGDFIQNSENLGVVGSIAKAFERVETSFCCYLPADDSMHPAAFADAVEGLSQNPSCVFAFGSSVMHFFSGDKLVGIRSRMCPYSQPGVYPGAAVRQLFINYPTDVVVARTQKLREIGGFFRESIRWNALLQSRGDVFFTGKPCLISGKYGANLSADWGKNGRTGEISMREIGSVLVSDRFTPAERFVTFVLSASIFSGTSVFRIMEAVSRDRGDRGYAQFLSVKKEEIVVELFKVLAGQFPFRSDSLKSDVQPQTHSGNVFCSKTEFLAFRDSIWRADLARELSARPDTAWAFS